MTDKIKVKNNINAKNKPLLSANLKANEYEIHLKRIKNQTNT
ncbi:hypothetical protein LFYK43_13460 [Ligilactobacillus salitolerans]|uniref:Uncharacterized protein n=1 Tax=Ligilactobacillus salitolerans TaxID=1808352 RepID=A0A401ITR3_9LACO|nr:hypothetical protein LFYK43_13460 [Ligilactobacillus salitolerans]